MTEWVSNINPVLVAIGAALLSLRCMHNWNRPESPLEFGVFLIVSFLIYFFHVSLLANGGDRSAAEPDPGESRDGLRGLE